MDAFTWEVDVDSFDFQLLRDTAIRMAVETATDDWDRFAMLMDIARANEAGIYQ